MAGPGGQEVGRISIRVVPNTDRFRQELKAQLEAIEKSSKVTIPVEFDLDTNGLRAKVRAATAGIDEKVNIKLDVDRSALDRLQGLGAGGGGKFGGGLPLGSFADTAALVAAAAALAAPALALITGALAAMPAVLAGVLTPIGVIALGLDGIKKAAEVLTEPLKTLKASISGVFETRLTPVFSQLAGLLPKLDGPLQSVANGISDVAQSFVDTITSATGLAKIQDTISNIAAAISAAAPGIGSLTGGLIGLADVVSAKFPAVSKWFNEAAGAFSNWVDKATADGSLQTAMGNLGDTIKAVFDLVGELAKQGFDFLKDPEFGNSMVNFVNSLKSLASDVLPSLKQLFMDLSGALTGAAEAVKVLKTFDPKTGKADVGPVLKDDLAAPFTSKNAPWRTMFDETKTSWIGTMGFLTLKAGEAFFNIKNIATAAFGSIVASAGQLLGNIWIGIASTASAAWAGIVGVVSGAIASIGSFFSQIPARLASAWAALGGIASGAWQAVVAAVQAAMQGAVAAVASGAAQVIAAVVNMGSQVVAAVSNFGSLLVGAGKALIQGLINGIQSMVGAAIGAAQSAASAVANAVKGALGIHSPSTVFHDIGVNTMAGLENGLDAGALSVLDKAKALSQQLADAMSSGNIGAGLPDELKRSLDELDLVNKGLKVGVDATDDKDKKKSLRDQMSQVQAIKDQLGLQKEQLGFSDKYGDSLNKNDQVLGSSLAKMVDAASGFANANLKQFQSDLGIGGGALTAAADQGIGFLTQSLGKLVGSAFGGIGTTINVGSVDDAMAIKQREDNKAALQFNQRRR